MRAAFHRSPVLLVAGLLMLALLAGACGGDSEDDPTATASPTVAGESTPAPTSTATSEADSRLVTIGVVQSLTGAGAVYGKTVVQGIELAAHQLNETAEDSGMTFELIPVDDQSAVDPARAAFEQLIDQGVDAIIGPPLSNVAPEGHRLAQEAGIPVLGATTTAVGITNTGDYIFRIALPEAVVVPATIARVAQERPITQAVLVLDSSDAFSRSSAEAIRSGLATEGGAILAEIDLATADLTTALAGLQGQPFDAFLVTPLVDTSAAALTAIRSAGFEQVVIGGNSFNTLDIARLAGDAVEGAYVGAAWNPGVSTPVSEAFVEAYTEAYGIAPDQFAAQGYASVQVLADAVSRADAEERAALRDALAATSDLETVLGVLSISAEREAIHTPVVQQYQGGQLVVIEQRQDAIAGSDSSD